MGIQPAVLGIQTRGTVSLKGLPGTSTIRMIPLIQSVKNYQTTGDSTICWETSGSIVRLVSYWPSSSTPYAAEVFSNSADCCRFAARERWGRRPLCWFSIARRSNGNSLYPCQCHFPGRQHQNKSKDRHLRRNRSRGSCIGRESSIRGSAAIESVDEIPPPIFHAIWSDKPRMLEWLLDHGAILSVETKIIAQPILSGAVIASNKDSISILVARGANTRAMRWRLL